MKTATRSMCVEPQLTVSEGMARIFSYLKIPVLLAIFRQFTAVNP